MREFTRAVLAAAQSASKPVICITGARHSGKTTRARALAAALRSSGLICAGVLERARFDRAGARLGYDFEDITTGECVRLARCRRPGPADIACGRYAFSQAGFEWAEDRLARAPREAAWFLDELGHLEAGYGGLWPLIKKWQSFGGPLIAVCRIDYCRAFSAMLGGFDMILAADRENLFFNNNMCAMKPNS